MTSLLDNYKALLAEKLPAAAVLEKMKSRLGTFKKSPVLFAEISRRLLSFVEAQATTTSNAEAGFLQLGRALQSVCTGAGNLAQQTRQTVERFGGNTEDSALRRLEVLVENALVALQTCQVQVNDNLNQIKAINSRLNDFYKMGAALERIAQFLRVVGLNICIESSASAEANEMFMVNALEIRKFSQDVIEIANNIRLDSQAARASLISAHDRIARGLLQLRGLAVEAEKVVQDAFARIERFMEIFLDIMQKAGSHSRQISQEIGEIVVGVQFHDNMNQRLEHINKAVHDAACLCAANNPAVRVNGAGAATLATVHSVTALQRLHLREIIDGIENVHQKNQASFRRISEEVARLSGDLAGPGRSPDSAAGAGVDRKQFDSLQAALLELNRLLGQGGDLTVQIQEAAVQASETAVRLMRHTKHVRSISHETHLKALNAIVKAVHLGERGSTIEVLANEIRLLSDQSYEFVGQVTEIHDAIAALSQNLQQRPLAGDDKPRFDTGIMQEAIAEISQAFDQFGAGSAAAHHCSEELKEAIAQVMADLDFLPAVADEFAGGWRELEEVEQRLSPWADRQKDGAAVDMNKLAQRYTMNQERRLHIQHLNGGPGAAPAKFLSGDDPPPTKEEDELGDNVELF